MRSIPAGTKYDSIVYVIDDKKLIVKLDCQCGDFKFRRIKKIGVASDVKYYAEPCKHLRPVVEALEKQGYVLKKPKPMKGAERCTAALRRFLFERSDGICECGCGRQGEEVHRKVPKANGGKYSRENCVLLNAECHKRITYQPWHASPGSKGISKLKSGGKNDKKKRI